MAFEYSLVKQALASFLQNALSLTGNQVFRAPPKATDITQYPAVVVRSATAVHTALEGEGPTKVVYTLLVGIYTRAATALQATDELDALLTTMDTAIATGNLSATGLTNSRWSGMSRLNQQTQFDDVIEDEIGMVVYGVTAGVEIQEQTPYMDG